MSAGTITYEVQFDNDNETKLIPEDIDDILKLIQEKFGTECDDVAEKYNDKIVESFFDVCYSSEDDWIMVKHDVYHFLNELTGKFQYFSWYLADDIEDKNNFFL